MGTKPCWRCGLSPWWRPLPCPPSWRVGSIRHRSSTSITSPVSPAGCGRCGSGRRRNPREAKAIVEEIVSCLGDPRYDGKSIGVVVLQGHGQIKLLEHEINAAVPIEEREKRQIRVGNAADFQGDERDVVFLSMVVVERPYAATAEMYRQSYNVAASRAKDQMWLFVSVPREELKAEDLRASLVDYMLNPPSIFGESPSLDQVPADRPCEPFDSMFEQRVFRELKKRGYHVVPQYPVGSRRLDLVVAGDGGRVAVECDGHRWHAGLDDQTNDARRDRELARCQPPLRTTT
ncbi:MAG: AAA domain-containing protein [Pseudonocardia sp.]